MNFQIPHFNNLTTCWIFYLPVVRSLGPKFLLILYKQLTFPNDRFFLWDVYISLIKVSFPLHNPFPSHQLLITTQQRFIFLKDIMQVSSDLNFFFTRSFRRREFPLLERSGQLGWGTVPLCGGKLNLNIKREADEGQLLELSTCVIGTCVCVEHGLQYRK